MLRKIFILMLIAFTLLTFGLSPKALEFYQSGLNAYQQENYKDALYYFEQSLIEDPSIEGYDPNIKFKAGISAYMIGDYDRAKAYLSSYKDNPLISNIFKELESKEKSDEWKNWIDKYTPTTSQEATPTETKKSSNKLFLFLITFAISFAVLGFMEYRVYKAKKLLPSSETAHPMSVVEEPSLIVEEGQTDLLQESTKIVNVEELLNSELDMITSLIGESNEDTKKVSKTLEDKEEKENEFEKEITEEINEVLEELTETIEENKEKVEKNQKEEEEEPITSEKTEEKLSEKADLKDEKETIEKELIEKLKTYIEVNKATEKEISDKKEQEEMEISIEEAEALESETSETTEEDILKTLDEKSPEEITEDDIKTISHIIKERLS
ncbi:hypothetical protein JYK00_06550 [Thermosipho ferrireducens]|uniref:Tetratricopeptide TPR_2 repeat protein n=1 Tax=Thermosipho ferrireducens TaxID=2571116 RepID=A0ABX7S5G8_9BACT|nr:hypothetical protein [Thermosipho ferrireducens]QTA37394.1 hypothetical protein JYK00_06550 [Thermosipho ferrireducens]